MSLSFVDLIVESDNGHNSIIFFNITILQFINNFRCLPAAGVERIEQTAHRRIHRCPHWKYLDAHRPIRQYKVGISM